jgi:hypothetical protein
MTIKKTVMLRNEAIRELFYRLRTANRSFVPQDDSPLFLNLVSPSESGDFATQTDRLTHS